MSTPPPYKLKNQPMLLPPLPPHAAPPPHAAAPHAAETSHLSVRISSRRLISIPFTPDSAVIQAENEELREKIYTVR